MEIKLASFNVRHCRGSNLQVNVKRIANIIKQEKIHIIGLNEVDRVFSKRTNYEDQPKLLAEELKMNYFFAPAIGDDQKGYGNCLLSTLPIEWAKAHCLKANSSFIENRSIIEAVIKIGHQQLTLFFTHFSLSPRFHQKQTNLLLEIASSCQTPFVLFGDWNCPSRSKRLSVFRENFTEVLSKPISTFPSFFPFVQLDYVFISNELTTTKAYASTVDKHASDHLPLVVQINML